MDLFFRYHRKDVQSLKKLLRNMYYIINKIDKEMCKTFEDMLWVYKKNPRF